VAVTLKEIAEASGTSVRSVNRALKGQSGVGAEKRAAIVQIAKELGYVPNIAARNLRMRQSNFVGIIVPLKQSEAQQRRLADLQARLEAEGMFPLMGSLREPEQLKQMLREWTGIVSTVIFCAWDSRIDSESLLNGFTQHYIFVDCSGITNRRDIIITVDRQAGIRQGVAQLAKSGRQRIAYCGYNMPNRISGFNSALEEVNPDKTEKLFITTEQIDFADGYNAAPEIMTSRADAVFFITDRLALGFLKYAYEHKIRIPEDIAVIGFDDDQPGHYSCPALSSVAHPISEINEKIIEILVTKNLTTKEFSYETIYNQRESS
jgi:DNA-binding LacI/PurR family transcriptional regulator